MFSSVLREFYVNLVLVWVQLLESSQFLQTRTKLFSKINNNIIIIII